MKFHLKVKAAASYWVIIPFQVSLIIHAAGSFTLEKLNQMPIYYFLFWIFFQILYFTHKLVEMKL